jgi:hypothetical protein
MSLLRSTALAVIVLAAVAATAQAVAAEALGTALKTQLRLYSPFAAGHLAAGVRVAREGRGYCWTGSGADARADAWRCFRGNYIHDPCFSDDAGGAKYVVCPLYRPGSKVLRLRLTKPLPVSMGNRRTDPTRHAPWAVRLASGLWCESLTGATGEIAGMPVSYGCDHGSYLLGSPDRRKPDWTIFYAANAKTSTLAQVTLRSAWW